MQDTVGPVEREARLALVEHDVRQKIDRHGFTIMGIFPSEGDGHPPFAYTVGLTVRKLPELMITLSADVQFLATFLEKITEKFLEDPAGAFAHEVNPPFEGRLHFEVEDRTFTVLLKVVKSEHIDTFPPSFAYRLYGDGNVGLLQAVVPDDQGRYPHEEAFDPRIIQSVLYG